MASKPRWNRETVVTEAAHLADQEGLEAVTLTRLAQHLGIRPPSLFNHVEGAGDLRKAIALDGLAGLAQALRGAAAAPSAEEALGALMTRYRHYVHEHPGRYRAILAFPATEALNDPAWEALDRSIVAEGLAVAARFGQTGAEALHWLRAWRAAAHGFSDLERQGGFGLPLEVEESFRHAVRALTPPLR